MFGVNQVLKWNCALLYYGRACYAATERERPLRANSPTQVHNPHPEPELILNDLFQPRDDNDFAESFTDIPIKNPELFLGEMTTLLCGLIGKGDAHNEIDILSFVNRKEDLTQYVIDLYIKKVLNQHCGENRLIVNLGCACYMKYNVGSIRSIDNKEHNKDSKPTKDEQCLLEMLFSESGETFFCDQNEDGSKRPMRNMHQLYEAMSKMDDIYFTMPLTEHGLHWFVMHYNKKEKRTTIYDSVAMKVHLYHRPNLNDHLNWRMLSAFLGAENTENIGFKQWPEFECNHHDCGVLALCVLRDLVLKRSIKHYNTRRMRPFLLNEILAGNPIYQTVILPVNK
ncbi:hypothetical protein ECANGB1_743 [Enterospora canceri]|uniref:Ubiquitin-like protease family profile domain-containing protein n=1 Tax=Enterospora canceri TaxID=1081671 RepID=A0A1Y1S7L2_9MICR|nr:hypothetical protein ECANGB1_743 [Enterospora canceri]